METDRFHRLHRQGAARSGAGDGRHRGVTLVEVLVAMAMLSMALLALIPMFAIGVRTNASSNQLSLANTLASEKLEELIGYPSTSPKLAIPSGADRLDSAAPGSPSGNDLPTWYNPKAGSTSKSTAKPPGTDWYRYPYSRTYAVQAFAGNMRPVTSTAGDEQAVYDVVNPPAAYYLVKQVTVTVQATEGPFPGLRRTTQSAYVRFRNALPN